MYITKCRKKLQKNEEYTSEEMFTDIQKFQKKLMLWGSNRVVKAWIDYRTNVSPDGSNALFLYGKYSVCHKKRYGI